MTPCRGDPWRYHCLKVTKSRRPINYNCR